MPPGAADAARLPPAAIWPAAAALGPLLRQVVAAWIAGQDRLADWEAASRAFPPAGAHWEPLARQIQLINAFQWREEDRSRAAGAVAAVLADVKRAIDASNGRRVRAVEALDAHIVGGLAAAGLLRAEAPLHCESPGSIVDRLSVLALKAHHLETARGAAGAGERSALAERLATVTEQWDDLLACLDDLGTNIAAGRARVKLYRQVKHYGQPS